MLLRRDQETSKIITTSPRIRGTDNLRRTSTFNMGAYLRLLSLRKATSNQRIVTSDQSLATFKWGKDPESID